MAFRVARPFGPRRSFDDLGRLAQSHSFVTNVRQACIYIAQAPFSDLENRSSHQLPRVARAMDGGTNLIDCMCHNLCRKVGKIAITPRSLATTYLDLLCGQFTAWSFVRVTAIIHEA